MSADFTLANLPFGVATGPHADGPRVFVALRDDAIDLYECQRRGALGALAVDVEVFAQPSLDAFLACGPDAWRTTRSRVAALAEWGVPRGAVVPRADLELRLPVTVGDYVDAYAGIHHAGNLGRILRPESEPLLPNYRRIPVAYHGRSGTVVVSGTDVVRPHGPTVAGDETVLRPTAMLDLELELGVIVGRTSPHGGRPLSLDDALDHVFGFVLLNDWSARDVQAFEYRPLGPFLGKSFATSISPWVVTLDALALHFVPGLADDAPELRAPYLRDGPAAVPDLHLEWSLQSAAMRAGGQPPLTVGRVDVRDACYWSVAQLLSHMTANGASLRVGDLVATGTLSGPDRDAQSGSLIERTWRGRDPLPLPSGETRAFLADGDTVVMRGWAGAGNTRVGFGELTGTVVGAHDEHDG